MAARAARWAVSLAVAFLIVVHFAGLEAVSGAMAQQVWPPDAAEIPTDGRRVEAIGKAPLGAIGAALQIIVVLACPAVCLAMGLLGRCEGRSARARHGGIGNGRGSDAVEPAHRAVGYFSETHE